MLIALLPAGGVVMCLGHDGHVGIGFGAVTTDHGCPCEHSPDVGVLASCLSFEEGEDEHPPCDDLVVETPQVFKDAGLAPSLAKAIAGLGGDDFLPVALLGWGPKIIWSDTTSASAECFADAASRVPRQQLELRRTVVFLI